MKMRRFGVVGAVVASTITFGLPAGVSLAVGCDAVTEVAVSGTVTDGGDAYPTWVEVAVGVDDGSGLPTWLQNFTGGPVPTDESGAYEVCVPRATYFWEVDDTVDVTHFQVFAYADLTGWDGSSAPALGYSAGAQVEVPAAETTTATSDVAMQAPTIWGSFADEVDYFLLFKGETITDEFGSYVGYNFAAGLPAVFPSEGGGTTNTGLMAAAYPFADASYRVRGYLDTSVGENYSSEMVLSSTVAVSGGSFGEVVDSNFYAALSYPTGVEPPQQDPNGGWIGQWPQIYVLSLEGECAVDPASNQNCFVESDQYDPGKIAVDLTPDAYYILAAQYGILPITYVVVRVDADGDVTYASSAEEFGEGITTTLAGPLSPSNPLILELAAPGLSLETRDSGGNAVRVNMHAEWWGIASEQQQEPWFVYLPAEQPAGGEGGLWGWNPTHAGVWRINLGNPYEYEYSAEGPNWGQTSYYVLVAVTDGDPSIVATCSIDASGAPVYVDDAPECPGDAPAVNPDNDASIFEILDANVIFQVIGLDGEPVANASVSARAGDVGPEVHASTSSNGWVAFRLDANTWSVTAQPPWGDLDQAATSIEIVVDESTTPDDPLVTEIELSEPNLKGLVLKPDGTVSRQSGINIQVLEGSQLVNVRWSQTDQNGRFNISLNEQGVYRLTFDPPGASDLPRFSVLVLVHDDGLCRVDSFDSTVEDCSPLVDENDDGRYEFEFVTGNFSGLVSDSEGEPVSGWISANPWVDELGRFEWIENGGRISGDGRFSLLLEPNTTYQLAIDPRGSSGATFTTRLVHVGDDGEWCIPDTPESEFTGDPGCAPDQSGDFLVELAGANFIGRVTDGEDPIPNAWVEASAETEYGFRSFAGAPVLRDGTFRLRLDRPGSDWTLVRITANPPWGDSDFVKTSQEIWVKNAQICLTEPAVGVCAAPLDLADDQEFVLGAGNVGGQILLPESLDSEPAAFVQISVERKTAEGWWEWADIWTQSDADGNYSLGLDDGEYRITARPYGIDGVSATSVEIQVPCDPDCLSTDIVLSPPNVTATINDSTGNPVPRAWVGVERYNGSWWEWTGIGDEADSNGDVAISIPVTENSETYRLVVNGPWNSLVSYPRKISDSFALVSSGDTTKDFPDLSFAAPNVNVVIKDPLGTADPGDDVLVRNAWVAVEKWNGSWWDWIDVGSSTNADGEAALFVDLSCLTDIASPCLLSDFRLVVESPWGGSGDLPRFTTNFAGIAVDGTPTELTYPTSNVSGRVMIDATRTNRNGWIEILEWDPILEVANGWLAGSPINRQGQFSLVLTEGTYLLRINGNGSVSAAPIEVIVEIDADGLFVSCTYRTGGDCSSADFDVAVSFADLPKNFELAVTLDGGEVPASAFVEMVNDETGERFNFVTDDVGSLLAAVPAGAYTITVVLPISGSDVVSWTSPSLVTVGVGTGDAGDIDERSSLVVDLEGSPG